MKIENEMYYSYDYLQNNKNDRIISNSQENKPSNEDDFENSQKNTEVLIRYSGENSFKIGLATKIYANKVIKEALRNIKSGDHIYENRRIIDIFSHIIGEKTDKIIYG